VTVDLPLVPPTATPVFNVKQFREELGSLHDSDAELAGALHFWMISSMADDTTRHLTSLVMPEPS